jgi:ElaB/YqjD/DUF883 family membrane-anchored ribosome-binding protein
MNEIDSLIRAKLDKYKITEMRYVQDFNQFINLGYSEKQANQIILRKCSSNTVQSVLSHHAELLKYFTLEQIIKIAGHDGGSKNIATVKKSCRKLQKWKLTAEQIVKIVGHGGGSKNIEAVKNSYHELQQLQLTAEQIVKIAGHDGGSKNIEAVKNSYHELQQLQLTAEQIVKIVGHGGGSKNIEAVKNSYHELQQLQLTVEQIVNIAGHDGGSKNIAALLRLSQLLVNSPEGMEAFESKKDDILFALFRKSGHVLLDKSLSHYNALAARGFTLKNILIILSMPQKHHQILNEILNDLKANTLTIPLDQTSLQKTIVAELNRRISSSEDGLHYADWQLFCELFNPLQAETEQEMFPIPLELLNEYLDEYSNEIEEVIQLNIALQKLDSSALQKESFFSGQKHVLDTKQLLSEDIAQRPKRKA